MKKFFTYISILMAGLAVSCIQNAEPEAATDFALSLEAQITDLETRSAGIDSLHENDIKVMDWFFFSDEKGTQLLYKTSTSTKRLDLDNATVTSNGLTGVSYLYAVANGPEGISEKTTLADILVMPVSMTYTKQVPDPDDDNKPYNKLDKDHLSFIMDTYNKETGKYLQELTPKQVDDGVAGSQQATIAVPLSRLAAKITPVVKIKKSVSTTDSFGNTENWTPILNNDDFDVYMLNALKAGKMDGVPVRRADEGVNQDDYFDYGRNVTDVMEMAQEDEYYVWRTVHPFYTYPQKWNDTDNLEPYIKIIFPWMSDVKGSAEFHYKIVLPKPKDNVFTLERNCWYQLTATIAVLGGTENDYVLIDDVEVSVADWAEPSWFTGTGLNSAKFFYVPTKVFDVYSMDSFNIPINTNSSAKAYIRKISFSDYSATPTNDLVFSKTSIIGTNATLVEASTIKRTQGDDNGKRFRGTENNYTVSVNSEDRYNKYVTLDHSLSGIYVQRDIEIYIEHSERSDWHETVIIHQHPAIELKKQGAGDVFVNGHFARVTNAVDENGNSFGTRWYDNDARVYFYHSLGGWSSNNGQIGSGDTGTNGYGTIMGTTDDLESSISTDFYTTDVTVTAFSSSNRTYNVDRVDRTYKIGDPRVAAGSLSLNNYVYGANGNNNRTRAWASPGSILVCSNADNEKDMIAPHFLVSSALNAMRTKVTLENAKKRAATYQEAGYPAGRWRLPTQAEIAFIIARQNDGTIPTLYAEGVDYWCASGRITAGTNRITTGTYNSSSTYSARFIYDLWYWGDETMSSNQYHPNQHEH